MTASVVDLSSMRGVRVNPENQTARAEGGATWGDFNAATYPFGLATTGGIISTTGVGGLTLGGGIGYLARGIGLSCDNLISADVVTADGRVLVASEQKNEDLFWALRGGGGNFGVVTSFEFRLGPVKDIYGGPIFFEPGTGRRCPPSSVSSSLMPRSIASRRVQSARCLRCSTAVRRSCRAEANFNTELSDECIGHLQHASRAARGARSLSDRGA